MEHPQVSKMNVNNARRSYQGIGKKEIARKGKLTLNYEKGEVNNNHDISDRFEDELCYLRSYLLPMMFGTQNLFGIWGMYDLSPSKTRHNLKAFSPSYYSRGELLGHQCDQICAMKKIIK